MCGSAGRKVAAKADTIKGKPLWIDLTSRKYIIEHRPDRHFVIGPEGHIWVEAEKACLPWAFGDQHVPATLQGSLSCLEIQFFARPIEAG